MSDWYTAYKGSQELRDRQEFECETIAKAHQLIFALKPDHNSTYEIVDTRRNGAVIYDGMLIHCLCYLQGWADCQLAQTLENPDD